MPFTPASGPRLLVAPGEDTLELRGYLVEGLRHLADAVDAQSLHVLFCGEEERNQLTRMGMLPRASLQFHWERRPEWSTFEDYLASMRSRSRKQVRRERRSAAESGLDLSFRPGTELSDEDWAAVWAFYQDTAAKKWGQAYLTRAFFTLLRERLSHRVMVAMAHAGGLPRAAALFLTRGDHLYGRYWGCEEEVQHLHFELCYYRPIEWALEHGIQRFEAGAQGEHKLKRGLLPARCHSSHWLRHPGLGQMVAQFLPAEAREIRQAMAELETHSPFRAEIVDGR